VPVTELSRRLLARQQGPARIRQPVAVIGPGDGDEQVCTAARFIARQLALSGLAVICGGRGGVMAAASQGAVEAGGIAIGVLPEDDTRAANPWLTVAIPTGMGEMRNAVIARSAICLVAIGGNMGTLSEMAMGLKWGKPVFTLHADMALPGATDCTEPEQLLAVLLEWLLASPTPPGPPATVQSV